MNDEMSCVILRRVVAALPAATLASFACLASFVTGSRLTKLSSFSLSFSLSLTLALLATAELPWSGGRVFAS